MKISPRWGVNNKMDGGACPPSHQVFMVIDLVMHPPWSSNMYHIKDPRTMFSHNRMIQFGLATCSV